MLLKTEPADQLSTRIQLTMYAQAPHCIGHAKEVKADPLLFRMYIADSVYRWVVAARNIESLIPAS